jgi:predicted dehydrogenase/putative sterol carrier protein
MVNVGIIGCGRIADLHALGYKDNPGARIYAVCDADVERAESRRVEWGAERAYANYRDLIQNPDVDAVEVLTPFETHERVVIDALRAEKHVAVQKPMTTDLKSADRMVAAARAVGVIFKVTEIYVCWPPIVLARKLLDDGAIGDPLGMRIKYICSPLGGWPVAAFTYEQQLAKAARGFGLETFDHGHHEWATAWYLLGPVERVSAWIDSNDGVVDCPATVMWKCRDAKRYGTCDLILASDLRIPTKYYANDEWYEISGTRGILLINRGTGSMREGPPVTVYDGHTWKDYDAPADWAEGFIGSTRNFIAAIKGEAKPLLTGEEGREVLRFALSIQRAASLRRDVYLDEFDHRFPGVYAWRRRRKERKGVIVGPGHKAPGGGGRTSKYAPQAKAETEKLLARFDPRAAQGWDCAIGLHLLADGGVQESSYTIRIAGGKLEVTSGDLPKDTFLTLRMPAGIWAAVLLGKKRIETAVLQGKIKWEGRAEEALKLRDVFRL